VFIAINFEFIKKIVALELFSFNDYSVSFTIK